jgi:hypothetical protein
MAIQPLKRKYNLERHFMSMHIDYISTCSDRIKYLETKLRIENVIYDVHKQYFLSLLNVASYKMAEILARKKGTP